MFRGTITNLEAKLARQVAAAKVTEVQIEGFERLQAQEGEKGIDAAAREVAARKDKK